MIFKINFFSKIIVILLLLLSAINIYAKNMPSWFIDPKSRYDENKYLSAIGEGLTLKDAQINAYGNLARIFSISIKFDAKSLERYKNSENNSYHNSFYEENTELQSLAELFGVEFKDNYTDNGIYYVIAVMDKKKSCSLLKKRISDNEEAIKIYMDNLSNEPIERYSVLDMVSILSKKNQMYSEQLLVMGQPVHLNYNPNTIQALLNEVSKELTFKLDLDNSYSSLAQNIQRSITKLGFKLSQNNAFYVFQVKMDWSDSREAPYGGYFIFYDFQIDLLNKNGDLIKTFSFDNSSGKEYGNSEVEARKFVLKKVTDTISDEFDDKLISFFNDFLQ